jgi:hypothetical protein
MGRNVTGKLFNGHYIGILGYRKGMLHLCLHQCQIRLVRSFVLGLSRLDTGLGLIDFKQIGVHRTHYNGIIDHNSKNLIYTDD